MCHVLSCLNKHRASLDLAESIPRLSSPSLSLYLHQPPIHRVLFDLTSFHSLAFILLALLSLLPSFLCFLFVF